MNAPTHILICDDYATMRRIIKNLLTELGFQNISEAEHGQMAYETLQAATVPFDFLITDWEMPVMTGIDLLKKVRAHERYADLKVLMITSSVSPERIKEAVASGVNGYMAKPFTAEILKEKIHKIFNKDEGVSHG